MRQTRPTKQVYRALFLALQADAKEYPGGVRALGDALGMNGNTLCNGLNPDHDNPPPSFGVILEIITLVQGKRSIFALSQLVDQIPMDINLAAGESKKDQINMFLSLVASASSILNKGAEAVRDNKFDSFERRELAPLLLALMQVTAQLYKSFNE